jgi:alginate O-acetyltransferase complex protein AlgI
MLISTVLDYVCSYAIEKGYRKTGLIASVIGNLGLLGFFKYFNFFVENVKTVVTFFGFSPERLLHLPKIALPIGISFYTFQTMSYTIDVYRRKTRANKNFIDFAAFVTMFPQLVAGPIVRYVDIAAQLKKRIVNSDRFVAGIQRFIVGLGKKVLIANTVAVPADQIFSLPAAQLTPGLAWFGLICYTLQIYFDFSGYSDMAIGMGKMFGFQFLENFNYPYISHSVQEFWRRWHISLSTWFRDYLYVPLGGNRVSPRRTYINLILVFFVTGLWHGAGWTFVIWGLYHGIFLILERIWLGKKLQTIWKPMTHLYTLLVVMMGWVLFRSETFAFAIQYLKAMVGFSAGDGLMVNVASYINNYLLLMIGMGLIGSIPICPFFKKINETTFTGRSHPSFQYFKMIFVTVNIISLLVIFILSVMSLSSGTYNPFIYYRF